jgi:hypothetical protein
MTNNSEYDLTPGKNRRPPKLIDKGVGSIDVQNEIIFGGMFEPNRIGVSLLTLIYPWENHR